MELIWRAGPNYEAVHFEHPDDPVNLFYRVEMINGKLVIDMFDCLSREPRRQLVIKQINPSRIEISS